MTKKHFELIARVLLSIKPRACDGLDMQDHIFEAGKFELWERIVIEFARVLELLNPKFQREKFLVACGFKEKEEAVK